MELIDVINMQTIIEKDTPMVSENSFLAETSFNSDIGIEVRKEIERKYKVSKANHNYIFPRKETCPTSRRKLPKPNTGNLLEKSLPSIGINQIYSREIFSLKKL